MKKVLFRYDAYEELGMGHAFRCIELIKQLKNVACVAALSKKTTLSFEQLKKNHIPFFIFDQCDELYDYVSGNSVDVVVNDILDTEKEYIIKLHEMNCRVINLEDNGEGSRYADAVINELYERETASGHVYNGKDYYCLPENMQEVSKNEYRESVENVIVLFGNTDPAYLTEKSITAIANIRCLQKIKVTVVVGAGNERMEAITALADDARQDIRVVKGGDISAILKFADLAICSQGRTMYELAHYAVPSIILAENERETLHTFAQLKNGFLNLGLGTEVSGECIAGAVTVLCESSNVRKALYDSMVDLHLEKGIDRVREIILLG